MTIIKKGYDIYQFYFYKPLYRATAEDNAVTRNTMLMLLAGINIAAITGDKNPCTAKERPTRLYKIESIKLTATIFFPDLAKAKNLSSSLTLHPSRIASHAGEN